MASREDRVIRNEVKARARNEGIDRLTPATVTALQILCECAQAQCMKLLEVSHDTYNDVRANPLRFIVAPGHELPEFERVISNEGGYLIVEKHPGDAAETAKDLDPRS
jgi:hypothetical protein